jgi:hypothetical protein
MPRSYQKIGSLSGMKKRAETHVSAHTLNFGNLTAGKQLFGNILI